MNKTDIIFCIVITLLMLAEFCFARGYFSWGENPKLEYYLMRFGITFVVIAIILLILMIII